MVARHDYYPFGEEIPASVGNRPVAESYGEPGLNQKFTGQFRDTESNLDYFTARFYSGPMGRFCSVDPNNAGSQSIDPQTWNAYAYVRNQPLNRIDPTGLADELTADELRRFNDHVRAMNRASNQRATPSVDRNTLVSSFAGRERNFVFDKKTVRQVGNSTFNETRSFSTESAPVGPSGPPIGEVRDLVATAIANSDLQKGSGARQVATDEEPGDRILENTVERAAFADSQRAARSVLVDKAFGVADPLKGADGLNFRINASEAPRGREPFVMGLGPIRNSFPNRDVPSKIAFLAIFRDPK